MTGTNTNKEIIQPDILTAEQDALLDMYLQNLAKIFDDIKESEKIQAEIETLHLKRLLSR